MISGRWTDIAVDEYRRIFICDVLVDMVHISRLGHDTLFQIFWKQLQLQAQDEMNPNDLAPRSSSL